MTPLTITVVVLTALVGVLLVLAVVFWDDSPDELPDDCHPSYAVCLPLHADVQCDEIPYRRFAVIGEDVYELDRDRDGVACE